METPQLHTATWAARVFGVSRDRIYQLVREHRLPHVRVGKRVYFDAKAIDEFVSSGGSGGGAAARDAASNRTD